MIVTGLVIPSHVNRGIKPNEKGGRMDVYVHGADSETLHGRPMTLQFFSDDVGYSQIFFVNEKSATEKFIEWADELPAKALHVVYCHNLDFDLPEFLWSCKEELVAHPGGEFSLEIGDWKIHGVYGKPTFCRMSNRRRNSQILIVDSFLWFQGSLARAAELFCPDLPKLSRPRKLGEIQFKKTNTNFVAYAMRDAEVAYHIGKAVQKIHAEFDIRQSVSLADMSAKIFRHHFLSYTIPQPTREVISAALQSYHGGKNNIVPDAAPAWHSDISSFDISSAFPDAMARMPAFSSAKLYKRMGKQRATKIRELPPYGVYQVSGRARDCDWPCLFTHGFDSIAGEFSDVWVQGIELNEGLRSGEISLRHVRGFYYEAERDKVHAPALRAFVQEFYARKEREPDPVLRHMYKIILNALYGKFIQTRKNSRISYTDIDANDTIEAYEVVAGGMFHPFIATGITADPRAFIHQLEHKYNAIHTATDGIFSARSSVIRVRGRPTVGLGSVNLEARGDLCLLRNKLYILYANSHTDKSSKAFKKSFASQAFEGKRILKYAMHGFQGNVFELERLVADNRRKYSVTRPNRLRESVKKDLVPNLFVKRPYTLKIGPLSVK